MLHGFRRLPSEQKIIITLLLASVLLSWHCNIQSLRHVDNYDSGTSQQPSHPYIIQKPNLKSHEYIQVHVPRRNQTRGPVLVPSHDRKYHLKYTLAPELESVVTIYPNNSFAIDQDVSNHLSFALIGFSKSGTTSLLRLLQNTNETVMFPKERCDMVNGDIPFLLNSLHSLERKKRGIKCPQELWSSRSSIQAGYKKFFHKTKLVVGIRHPILWFESMYNFNVRNANNMISTDKLSRCGRGSHGVCAWRMNIPDFLSWLNKTPLGNDEGAFMNLKADIDAKKTGNVGPVFLYEMDQLKGEDNNGTIGTVFRKDLAAFLDIQDGLPELPHISTAGSMDFIEGMKEFTENFTIDICDDEHSFIRSVLMEKSRTSSEWIQKYFISSEDVHVSSRDYFLNRMQQWHTDPCIERKKTNHRIKETKKL